MTARRAAAAVFAIVATLWAQVPAHGASERWVLAADGSGETLCAFDGDRGLCWNYGANREYFKQSKFVSTDPPLDGRATCGDAPAKEAPTEQAVVRRAGDSIALFENGKSTVLSLAPSKKGFAVAQVATQSPVDDKSGRWKSDEPGSGSYNCEIVDRRVICDPEFHPNNYEKRRATPGQIRVALPEPVDELVAVDGGLCARGRSVTCFAWGEKEKLPRIRKPIPYAARNARRLAPGSENEICLLDDEGAKCWTPSTGARTRAIPEARAIAAARYSGLCWLTASGALECDSQKGSEDYWAFRAMLRLAPDFCPPEFRIDRLAPDFLSLARMAPPAHAAYFRALADVARALDGKAGGPERAQARAFAMELARPAVEFESAPAFENDVAPRFAAALGRARAQASAPGIQNLRASRAIVAIASRMLKAARAGAAPFGLSPSGPWPSPAEIEGLRRSERSAFLAEALEMLAPFAQAPAPPLPQKRGRR